MCDIKSNQSTSKKPHNVLDLSKLDVLLQVPSGTMLNGSTHADP